MGGTRSSGATKTLAARVTGFVADARSSGAVGSRAVGGLVGGGGSRVHGGPRSMVARSRRSGITSPWPRSRHRELPERRRTYSRAWRRAAPPWPPPARGAATTVTPVARR